jgi:hypothetical protein
LLVFGAVGLRRTVSRQTSKHLEAGAGMLLLLAPSAQALVLREHGIVLHLAPLAMLSFVLVAVRLGRSGWALALVIPAATWTMLSAIVSLATPGIWGSIWVYGLAGAACFTSRVARHGNAGTAARVSAAVTLGVLLAAPSAQALVFREHVLVAVAVSFAGVAALAVAAWKPSAWPVRERDAVLVGLAAAALGPAVLALVACMGHTASELDVPSELGPVPRWFYLAFSGAVSLCLLGMAVVGRALQTEPRRLLEIAALAAGPGVFCLLSFPVVREDVLYSTLVLLWGGAGLLIAVWRRRLLLSSASAGLVLLVLGVQYFAKLTRAVHWGLLALGFGLLLLCLAAAYERKLKRLLADSRPWGW